MKREYKVKGEQSVDVRVSLKEIVDILFQERTKLTGDPNRSFKNGNLYEFDYTERNDVFIRNVTEDEQKFYDALTTVANHFSKLKKSELTGEPSVEEMREMMKGVQPQVVPNPIKVSEKPPHELFLDVFKVVTEAKQNLASLALQISQIKNGDENTLSLAMDTADELLMSSLDMACLYYMWRYVNIDLFEATLKSDIIASVTDKRLNELFFDKGMFTTLKMVGDGFIRKEKDNV